MGVAEGVAVAVVVAAVAARLCLALVPLLLPQLLLATKALSLAWLLECRLVVLTVVPP